MTFDLEKARAVCKTLPKYMNGACPCKEEAEAAKMLIKALPEIRRLQEFRDRVARILKQPLTDCDDLLILGLDARICQLRRQAAEIERLRADYDKLKSSLLVIDGCKKLMNQAARIDELEADNQNLVTLNKSLMNNDWILRDNNRKYRKRAQKAELLNKELKADLEQSERVIEARLEVIDQQATQIRELQAEGKIGPDDSKKISHLRPYEVVAADLAGMLAKSWQITEDRVTAIDQGLRFLEWSNAKTGHVETKKRIAILKTMLEEASDEHGFER